MLRGVTVPPGFDPKGIEGADLVKDRYELGAAVVGTVACRISGSSAGRTRGRPSAW
jgi:hypothetical protein